MYEFENTAIAQPTTTEVESEVISIVDVTKAKQAVRKCGSMNELLDAIDDLSLDELRTLESYLRISVEYRSQLSESIASRVCPPQVFPFTQLPNVQLPTINIKPVHVTLPDVPKFDAFEMPDVSAKMPKVAIPRIPQLGALQHHSVDAIV